MKNRLKQIWKMASSRVGAIAILAVIELVAFVFIFKYFSEKAAWIESILRIASVIITLDIIYKSKHLSQDLLWVLLVTAAPIFGTLLYLFLGANLMISQTFRNIQEETEKARKYLVQDREVMKEFEDDAPNMRGQVHYLADSAGFPVCRNNGFDYYGTGEEGFPVILEELKKASRFIFMEYFIIEPGVMWNRILKILEDKVAQGVEVRVMYDDFGSITTLPADYTKHLEEKGIKAVTFNQVNPVLNIIMNHRDHRKILVIDGDVCFTGGINLADEYINEKERFGYWKDNLIRIKGEAVWTNTVLFLTNWNALRHEDDDYEVYHVKNELTEYDGYIAAYGDTPLDSEITGQNVYMNIINQANYYVYISTPYLIIDTDMINSLILAAKRGVDVVIVTPGIPDKPLVWQVTKSYYEQLIEGGVHIYEYTPGFVHSKIFVADDIVATVGTINLDYRSLYLHFENGTYLYDSTKVVDVRNDMLNMINASHSVAQGEMKGNPLLRAMRAIIKLFSPLL